MANPFKVAENNAAPKVKEATPVVVPEVKEEKKAPQVKEQPVAVTPKGNPLVGMLEDKPAGRGHSFYLEADMAAALDRFAKQNKVSKSKALNAILRNFFSEK